ncbi:MAG: hypothetical protein ABJD07_15595 [Gemmatimonadaceae bacterium]
MKRLSLVLVAGLAAACIAPKAPPLRGELAPARLPRLEMPALHRKLIFKWTYRDVDYSFHGDGAARIAPPDSVRLDFFIDGGLGGGFATLIGDELTTPGPDFVTKMLPPSPMLWAALGRLRAPALADTVVRIDGDTTRADIGHDPRWRAAIVAGSLRGLDVIEGDRLSQSLARTTTGDARYQHYRGKRTLELTITRVDTVPDFDASIWH